MKSQDNSDSQVKAKRYLMAFYLGKYVLLVMSNPESWLAFPEQTPREYVGHPTKIDKGLSGETKLVRTCYPLSVFTDCRLLLEMVKF